MNDERTPLQLLCLMRVYQLGWVYGYIKGRFFSKADEINLHKFGNITDSYCDGFVDGCKEGILIGDPEAEVKEIHKYD